MRADVLLVERGLCPSRQKAKEIILSGSAFADGTIIKKPSQEFPENTIFTVDTNALSLRYVGRGGQKLEGAIEKFGIAIKDTICMDIGASTGGFTDCLLQHGARYVYAVDVGHGQLAPKLLQDPRVLNLEGINVRDLNRKIVPEDMDFICSDVSFISLSHVLPAVTQFLKRDGQAVFLIKPQFEAGKQNVGKHGIVRDPVVHQKVLTTVLSICKQERFSIFGLTYSPICGGDGNIEYLLYFGKQGPSQTYTDVQLKNLIQDAFQFLKYQ